MIDSITFVIPTFATGDTLPTLLDRIATIAPTISRSHSVVVVDDACPHDSGLTVAGRDGVDVYRFDVNRGQRTAVLTGLSLVRSTIACVMDADLQDDPMSVGELLSALIESGADVVCAGREGDHQSLWRRAQASGFRRIRWAASRGRIPFDAGLFHVARADAVQAMIDVARPGDDPLVAYVHSGARILSLPIRRQQRPRGRSSYTVASRVMLAAASIGGLLRPVRAHEPMPRPSQINRTEPL